MGATVTGPGTIEWNVAPKCLSPRYVSIEGRGVRWGTSPFVDEPAPQLSYHADGMDDPRCTLDIIVKCRQCEACLKQRASEWSYRAKSEIHASARTWFGTMTLRPQEHYLAQCRAMARLTSRAVRWDELSPAEQFQARHNEISKEITKWLKRIRKESGSRLRYLTVAEAHKSGLPHYHTLIHESFIGSPVGERTLRRQWTLGHSKFNLVEGSVHAWYVAKYLAKASEARVRASIRYGLSGL